MHSGWTFDKFQVFEMSLTETDTVISHSSNCSLLLLPLEAAEGSKLALGCLPQHNLFPFALPFWAEAAQPRASHSLGTAKPGFPRSAVKSRAGLGAGEGAAGDFSSASQSPATNWAAHLRARSDPTVRQRAPSQDPATKQILQARRDFMIPFQQNNLRVYSTHYL